MRKLQAKGSVIIKDDPNAVKRKRASSDDIADRVERNLSTSKGTDTSVLWLTVYLFVFLNGTYSSKSPSAVSDENSTAEEEPAQKKRREQLEYIQSEEFQRILNAKSSNSWMMGEVCILAELHFACVLIWMSVLWYVMMSQLVGGAYGEIWPDCFVCFGFWCVSFATCNMKWWKSCPSGACMRVWPNFMRVDWGTGHAGVFWAAGAKRKDGGEDEEHQGNEVSGRHLQNRKSINLQLEFWNSSGPLENPCGVETVCLIQVLTKTEWFLLRH